MNSNTCIYSRFNLVNIKKLAILVPALVLSSCSSSDDEGGPIIAPSSIAGRTYIMSIQSGNGVFATTGQFTAAFSEIDNTYTVTGDGVNSNDSTGTYSYESLENTGRVTFSDSGAGEGSYEIIYISSVSGSFIARLESDPASRQDGSFTE